MRYGLRIKCCGNVPRSLLIPRTARTRQDQADGPDGNILLSDTVRNSTDGAKRWIVNYTIFEGTSEIQRLVIARAISGLRVE